MKKRSLRLSVALSRYVFVLFLALPISTLAANLVVTNVNDSGAGSLRQAILDANSNNQPDTISFDPQVFSVPQTILLTSGVLDINSDTPYPQEPHKVTIIGPGAQLLTISGNNQSRVIRLGLLAQAEISGVTITGGYAESGIEWSGSGGGILVPGGDGSGRDNLVLRRSVVTGNTAPLNGGGILTGGNIRIEDSAIYDNVAMGGGRWTIH